MAGVLALPGSVRSGGSCVAGRCICGGCGTYVSKKKTEAQCNVRGKKTNKEMRSQRRDIKKKKELKRGRKKAKVRTEAPGGEVDDGVVEMGVLGTVEGEREGTGTAPVCIEERCVVLMMTSPAGEAPRGEGPGLDLAPRAASVKVDVSIHAHRQRKKAKRAAAEV